MTPSRWISRLVLLAGFALASCASKPYDGGTPELFRGALAQAADNGKPVLFDLFATW